MREQGIALENHAHVALVGRQFADVVAVHEDPATVWRVKTGKHHQSGGLARTAGAEQGQKFALADVQVEVVDDPTAFVIGLVYTFEPNQYRTLRFGCCDVVGQWHRHPG
ncbi:hypothetical protein D9M71_797540 [compost metagenome]